MKYYVYLLTLLITNFCFSQKRSGSDSLSLYGIALREKISVLVDAKYFRIGKPYNSEVLYVDAPYDIGKQLPGELSGFIIRVLSREDILAYTRKGKELFLVEIDPINVKGELLEIDVSSFNAKQLKKRLFYGKAGRMIAQFQFNCIKKKYEISDIKTFDQ